MPQVARPDGFGLQAPHQLAENGFVPAPGVHQPKQPALFLALFALERRFELLTALSHGGLVARTPIILVAQHPALGSDGQLIERLQIVRISRREQGTHNHARPANARVKAKAVVSRLGHLVIAQGRFNLEQTRSLGPCSLPQTRVPGCLSHSPFGLFCSRTLESARYSQPSPCAGRGVPSPSHARRRMTGRGLVGADEAGDYQ